MPAFYFNPMDTEEGEGTDHLQPGRAEESLHTPQHQAEPAGDTPPPNAVEAAHQAVQQLLAAEAIQDAQIDEQLLEGPQDRFPERDDSDEPEALVDSLSLWISLTRSRSDRVYKWKQALVYMLECSEALDALTQVLQSPFPGDLISNLLVALPTPGVPQAVPTAAVHPLPVIQAEVPAAAAADASPAPCLALAAAEPPPPPPPPVARSHRWANEDAPTADMAANLEELGAPDEKGAEQGATFAPECPSLDALDWMVGRKRTRTRRELLYALQMAGIQDLPTSSPSYRRIHLFQVQIRYHELAKSPSTSTPRVLALDTLYIPTGATVAQILEASHPRTLQFQLWIGSRLSAFVTNKPSGHGALRQFELDVELPIEGGPPVTVTNHSRHERLPVPPCMVTVRRMVYGWQTVNMVSVTATLTAEPKTLHADAHNQFVRNHRHIILSPVASSWKGIRREDLFVSTMAGTSTPVRVFKVTPTTDQLAWMKFKSEDGPEQRYNLEDDPRDTARDQPPASNGRDSSARRPRTCSTTRNGHTTRSASSDSASGELIRENGPSRPAPGRVPSAAASRSATFRPRSTSRTRTVRPSIWSGRHYSPTDPWDKRQLTKPRRTPK